MKFNDTSNLQGLVQDFERLTGIGIGNVSGDTTQLKNFTARANHWLDRAVGIILGADNRWQWDDTNFTDAPTGTISLVAGTDTYDLPAAWNLLRIERFEIATSSGTFNLLAPIDQADITQGYTTYRSTAGTPIEIDVRGNKFTLKPAPSYNLAGGLKVYFQRRPSYFVSTDTTKEPGIPAVAHRLLSYGAAYDYAIEKTLSNIVVLRDEIDRMEQRLEEFISERSRYEKLRIIPKRYGYNPAR
jgi:hypothetical protein